MTLRLAPLAQGTWRRLGRGTWASSCRTCSPSTRTTRTLAAAEADADVRACWDGERALLTDVVRGSWRLASALLHPDFREFGSSGGVITLASLRADLAPLTYPLDVEPVETVRLGPDAILLVWRSRRGGDDGRLVNRSSVWVRHRGQWVMRFHQGTVAT